MIFGAAPTKDLGSSQKESLAAGKKSDASDESDASISPLGRGWQPEAVRDAPLVGVLP
jgi:hypothetical protein